MFAVVNELSGTKCRKQADLEKSFVENDQGGTIEFGADQCMALCL